MSDVDPAHVEAVARAMIEVAYRLLGTATHGDLIMDAIREHIGADEVAMVTHYVVTAAIIQPDGSEATIKFPSPGMPLWQQHGLLSYEAAALIPQPEYERPDDDEAEEVQG